MEKDSVLKFSITVTLIKSGTDERLCIIGLSFSDPSSSILSIDICCLYPEVLTGPQLSIYEMTSRECILEMTQAIRC